MTSSIPTSLERQLASASLSYLVDLRVYAEQLSSALEAESMNPKKIIELLAECGATLETVACYTNVLTRELAVKADDEEDYHV